MNKSGFTLVELSIVLVVVGLLIGGILVGQSLIDSTKSKRLLNEINSYIVAWDQFKVKYKQVPGDSNLFPNPGNADKIIDNNEAPRTLNHLFYGGFLKGGPWTLTSSTGPVTIGLNYPASELFKDCGYLFAGSAYYGSGSTPSGKLYKMHLSGGGVSGNPGTMRTNCLPRDYAWYIDEKIDNNVPDSGFIRGLGNSEWLPYRQQPQDGKSYLIMWIID